MGAMNPEIKEKWVAALRSGDYRQCGDMLQDKKGRFCCLGVLEDLRKKKDQEAWGDDGKSYGCSNATISWSGIDDVATEVLYEGSVVELTYLNDAVGLDFNEISDLIEEQL